MAEDIWAEVQDLGLCKDYPGLSRNEWQDDPWRTKTPAAGGSKTMDTQPVAEEQDSHAAGGSKTMEQQPVAAGGSTWAYVKLKGTPLQTFRTIVSKYTVVSESALEEAVTQAYSEMQTQHPEIVWTLQQFRKRFLSEKKRTDKPKRVHKWTLLQIEWLTKEYRHCPPDFVANRFYEKFRIRVSEAAVRSAFYRYMPKKKETDVSPDTGNARPAP